MSELVCYIQDNFLISEFSYSHVQHSKGLYAAVDDKQPHKYSEWRLRLVLIGWDDKGAQ
ncbi:MAG: hypothetical protein KDD45_03910 [Bdellovibrionales bacterium]|nr:hypothetical protein [Bdellovibrionales bacterium]